MNMFHVSPEECILVKFVQSQYAEDICNGKLYCKNVDFFRNLSNKTGQGDDMEAIAYSYQDANTRIKIELDGTSNFLFCLYSLPPVHVTKDRGFYKLPHKAINKFVQFFENPWDVDCIYIPEPDEYISKVVEACKKKNISVIPSMVSYVDTEKYAPNAKDVIHDRLEAVVTTSQSAYCVAFIKTTEYSWQQEFRFLLYNIPENELGSMSDFFILDIGDVSNIVYRCPNCFAPIL